MTANSNDPLPANLERVREFVVDDFESAAHLRLRFRGSDRVLEAEATVELEDGWELTQTFERASGTWVAKGDPELMHPITPERVPTVRLRKRTIDRYVPEINALLQDALDIDDRLHARPEWRETLAGWGLATIRSRRGGKQVVDLDEVESQVAQGWSLPRIAARLGVTHQALANARYRAGRRSISDERDR